MSSGSLPFYLAGKPATSPRTLEVIDKWTQAVGASVCLAAPGTIDSAIAAAVTAAPEVGAMPAHERAASLRRASEQILAHAADLARTIVLDSGKPVRDARAEVGRAADTFRAAAEEAVRIRGDYRALDDSERGNGYELTSRRVPVGPCSFITPFNFPLNLVAHKVAPAIAAGCPFVLKPSDKAPLSALRLGAILADCALPEGAFSILPALVEEAGALITDDRIKLLSFTGSAKVGWDLKQRCGKKKIVLELGGDAAAIVAPDADIEHAVRRLTVGAFSNSGQSCISVQRVIVHESIYARVRDAFVAAASALRAGDPGMDSTSVGPLITLADAQRVERWVGSAAAGGASILCGGKRHGAVYEPTLLENVPPSCELGCEEVFGPVACLAPYRELAEAFESVNSSRYGLQAGLFTRDLGSALLAWKSLDVGAVVINDVPTFRTESMPYGGVKDSGFGREGIRSSIREMTEERLLIINTGAIRPGP